MSNFREYPKVMKHPQHQNAVWRQLPGKGTGLFAPDTVCDSPERFPDVTVATVDQEKQYAARGYRPNSIPDQEAYDQAILESAPVNGYVNHDYPRWMYHAMEIPVIVNNMEEEMRLGTLWSRTPIIATEDDLIEDTQIESVEKMDKRSKAYKESQKAA